MKYSENQYLNALQWWYGCNKTQARKEMKIHTVTALNEITKAFCDNARRSFYED